MLLLDTSVLVESEREQFDLRAWLTEIDEPVYVCDATRVEFLAGEPLKDAGKRLRFRRFVERTLSLFPCLPLSADACVQAAARIVVARSRGRTVPLGDALHAGVADAFGLEVVTIDTQHFADMGLSSVNPLKQRAS